MAEIRQTIKDDDGNITYDKAIQLPESILAALAGACEQHLIGQNAAVPNPDFDDSQPESDSNQSTMYYTGDDAIAYTVRLFLTKLLGAAIIKQRVDAEKATALAEVNALVASSVTVVE
jgi:hypothetical protein